MSRTVRSKYRNMAAKNSNQKSSGPMKRKPKYETAREAIEKQLMEKD